MTETTTDTVTTLDPGEYYEIEISSDFSPTHIEVNGEGLVTVVAIDGVDFHERRLERELDGTDIDHARGVLLDQLACSYDAESIYVDFSGDNLEFSLLLGKVDTVENAVEAAWLFIATVNNITDPGTFGSPYIFD